MRESSQPVSKDHEQNKNWKEYDPQYYNNNAGLYEIIMSFNCRHVKALEFFILKIKELEPALKAQENIGSSMSELLEEKFVHDITTWKVQAWRDETNRPSLFPSNENIANATLPLIFLILGAYYF